MPPKTKSKTPLYKAQEELDSIWESLFEKHVVINDNLIHFFVSQEQEILYKQGYITAIAETNEKYGVVLTRSSFDITLNNVFQNVSIQSYKTNFETLNWEDLYPVEMKAARETAQKKQEKEATRIAKWLSVKINIDHEIIDL